MNSKMKIAGIIAAVILVICGLKLAVDHGLGGGKILAAVNLKGLGGNTSMDELKDGDVTIKPLPSTKPVKNGKPVAGYMYGWNANLPIILASGGPVTTEGSFLAEKGIKMTLTREETNDKMIAKMVASAKHLEAGKPEADDIQFITVMGDGAGASFMAPLMEQMQSISKEHRPIIIGNSGYSRGEDKFIGPKEWRDNPQLARGGMFKGPDGQMWGSVTVGVIRDGDWNIAQKFGFDNKIKNNPDLKTFDADAMNWMGVDSPADAAAKYAAGAVEERVMVKDGKPTGRKIKVMVRAAVLWTPADVVAFEKKPGWVSIADTSMYKYQMPCTIIVNRKWAYANEDTVLKMLAAIYDAADQIKHNPKALTFAAEAAQAIYKENGWTGASWEKYYKGDKVMDTTTGEQVTLGGSTVSNLADAMQLFGLLPGQDEKKSTYRSVYTMFADTAHEQYPNDVKSYPAYDEVVDTHFLKKLAGGGNVKAESAEKSQYATEIKQQVSKRNWAITFENGSARFTPSAVKELELMRRTLAVDDMTLAIGGYTDSVGDEQKNVQLSRERAQAVKKYLTDAGFAEKRFAKVEGYGKANPVGNNATAAGRAANRRVEIIQGN